MYTECFSLPRSSCFRVEHMSLAVDQLCQQFREEWSTRRPDLSTFLSSLTAEERSQGAARLIEIDVSLRQRAGETPSPDDYRECLSRDELGRLSRVFEVEQFTKSTGARRSEQTWRDGTAEGPPVNRQQIGRYQVLGILGEGTFGTVYRAHDQGLSREVAIKVPRIGSENPSALVASLLQEARDAAKVSHPNIVTVHDCGQLDEGDCYIVFEFVPGGHLGNELLNGPLKPDRCIELMIQIAEGVHHAHAHGLFHRDLKPSNILIGPSGNPKIADFGLAVLEDRQLDIVNEITGTPSYMSPEQIRGETRSLDGRTDVWSLGVILYEMLTGTRPFKGKDLEGLFDRIQTETVRPLRQINDAIPRELDTICRKCLRINPDQRYSTAGDLADDLRTLQSQSTPVAASHFEATGSFKAVGSRGDLPPERFQPSVSDSPRKTSKKNRRSLLLLAPLIALFAAGAYWGSELLDHPTPIPSTVWGPQLTERPRVFAWDRERNTPPPLFDAKEQAYSIRKSPIGHLFAITGSQPTAPFQARLAIDIDSDWMGYAGVIWGIRDSSDPFPDRKRFCYAVRFDKHRAGEPPHIRLDEISFSNTDSVEWKASTVSMIDQIPVSEPLKGKAVLIISVRKDKLSIRFDNQKLNGNKSWEPEFPSWRESWLPESPCTMGITGRGNLVVISQLQVDPLDP